MLTMRKKRHHVVVVAAVVVAGAVKERQKPAAKVKNLAVKNLALRALVKSPTMPTIRNLQRGVLMDEPSMLILTTTSKTMTKPLP